jgi:hypothetical protein
MRTDVSDAIRGGRLARARGRHRPDPAGLAAGPPDSRRRDPRRWARVVSAAIVVWASSPTRRVRGAATQRQRKGSAEVRKPGRSTTRCDCRPSKPYTSGVPSRRRSMEGTRARFPSAGRVRRGPAWSGPRSTRFRRAKESSAPASWLLSRSIPAKATRFAGIVNRVRRQRAWSSVPEISRRQLRDPNFPTVRSGAIRCSERGGPRPTPRISDSLTCGRRLLVD